MEKLNTFQEYKTMVDKDLKYDLLTINEYQMKLPGIKHFYVAHLISNKIELDKLWELYNDSIDAMSKKILESSEIPISKANAKSMAEDSDLPKKIKRSIKEKQLIIEYLEKVEKILSSATYDLKNSIDLMRLETQ